MNLKSIFYLHRSDRKVLLLLLLFIVGSIGLIIFVGNQTTETSAVKSDSISKNKPTSFSHKEQLPTVETAEGKHLFLSIQYSYSRRVAAVRLSSFPST